MKLFRLLGYRRTRDYKKLNRSAASLANCILAAARDRAEKQWYLYGSPAVGLHATGSTAAFEAYVELHWAKCLTKDEREALDAYNSLNDA
jgi:hypothetical protein